jgi:hypothetical protein
MKQYVLVLNGADVLSPVSGDFPLVEGGKWLELVEMNESSEFVAPGFVDTLTETECQRRFFERAGYSLLRAMAYPSANEQLDMLWHAMNSGMVPTSEPFYTRIKAVKDSIPKM